MREKTETKLLNADELARRLRVSPETVTKWARSGIIPEMKISRSTRRFDWNAVVRALKRTVSEVGLRHDIR